MIGKLVIYRDYPVMGAGHKTITLAGMVINKGRLDTHDKYPIVMWNSPDGEYKSYVWISDIIGENDFVIEASWHRADRRGGS